MAAWNLKCLTQWRALAGLMILLLQPSLAGAHDYWLEPDRFQVVPSEPVQLRLVLGQDFRPEKEQVLQTERTPRFELWGPRRRPVTLLDPVRVGKSPVAVMTLPAEGTWLAGMERGMASISFGRSKFMEYLEHEGLALPACGFPPGKKSVRERYQRFLSVLLQCGDRASVFGMKTVDAPLQIVLARNPYLQPAPAKMGFRVLAEGKSLAGCRVTVLHRQGGKITATPVVTDARGRGTFAFTPDGRWLLRCVQLEAAPEGNPERADWQSCWTALTFGFDVQPAG